MRSTASLLVFLVGCSSHSSPAVFTGARDHGDKPGFGLEFHFMGDRVVKGTLSIIVPSGLAEIEGTDRVDHAIRVISQDAAKITFGVDLRVGDETRPFVYDAWLTKQPDGTLHVLVDDSGAGTPHDHLGPPIVLERVRG